MEEQEVCVACGKKWYSKWYKDGFCYDCQNDGTYDEHLHQQSMGRLINSVVKVVLLGALVVGLVIIFS